MCQCGAITKPQIVSIFRCWISQWFDDGDNGMGGNAYSGEVLCVASTD